MESFSEACENAKICLWPGSFAPLDPLPGLCPGFTEGLGGPLDPRPNLLFSKMTLLFHFIMKILIMRTDRQSANLQSPLAKKSDLTTYPFHTIVNTHFFFLNCTRSHFVLPTVLFASQFLALKDN